VPLIQTIGSGSARSFGLNSFGVPSLPTSLTTNLVSWYDASSTSTITTSGGKVTNWSNKVSPGTRDLSQATDDYRPTVNYSAFSLPSIQFDGTDDYLFHGLANQLSTGYTIAVIAKRNNAVDQSGFYPRVLSISPTSRLSTDGFDYNSTNGVIINSAPGANRIGSWGNGIDRVIDADIDDQFLAVARHSNSLGYGNFLVNNTTVNNTNSYVIPVDGPNRTYQMTAMNGGMTIGANNHAVPATPSAANGGGNNENFAGYVAEILIWNYYLSDAELATLGAYVRQKWALGPLWTTPVLSGYQAGSSYSRQLATLAIGGEQVTYSLVSGSLPPGTSLSSSGLISGTVTAGTTATYSPIIEARSSSGYATRQSFSISDELYSFSSFTFTTAGTTGRTGPSLSTLRSAYSSASWASTYLNLGGYNGYQLWTVPKSGTYKITAAGASGNGTYGSRPGGAGAIVSGNVALTKNQVVGIVCGQIGTGATQTGGNSGSAGGGGSFVWRNSDNALLMAAGGGGGAAGNWSSGGSNGVNASYTTSGTAGSPGGSGGTSGGAGTYPGGRSAASGAGWTNSGSPSNSSSPGGGLTFSSGFTGGNNYNGTLWSSDGGFGGGGGGYDTAGGGGGGYSGGGAGAAPSQGAGGGGGGSFKTGTSQSDVGLNGGTFIGNGTGNQGYVTIEFVSA